MSGAQVACGVIDRGIHTQGYLAEAPVRRF